MHLIAESLFFRAWQGSCCDQFFSAAGCENFSIASPGVVDPLSAGSLVLIYGSYSLIPAFGDCMGLAMILSPNPFEQVS